MDAVLSCSGLTKTFASEPPVTPVRDLEFSLAPGEFAAVTGVSGRGKSTLLNLLGGLLAPDAGEVLFKGEDLTKMSAAQIDALHRRGIGFVFQSPYVYQALTARENLVFACKASGAAVDEARIDAVLEEFGLTDRAGHLPAELSVGQKRRLVIARVLLGDHEVILADEPTNDLDHDWSEYVYRRLRDFASKEGKSVVVVTHDLAFARHADSVYVLEDGNLKLREEER